MEKPNNDKLHDLSVAIAIYVLEKHVDSDKCDYRGIVDHAHTAYLRAMEIMKSTNTIPTRAGDFDHRTYGRPEQELTESNP